LGGAWFHGGAALAGRSSHQGASPWFYFFLLYKRAQKKTAPWGGFFISQTKV
jgi:hypothetical protein